MGGQSQLALQVFPILLLLATSGCSAVQPYHTSVVCLSALLLSIDTGKPAERKRVAGEWLAVATNTNAHTYEVAPVFTLAEIEVLAKMARVVGGAYAQTHDGLFVPGGSIANLYGAPIPFFWPISATYCNLIPLLVMA